MKNETVSTFCGSLLVLYARRWSRRALLLKNVAEPW